MTQAPGRMTSGVIMLGDAGRPDDDVGPPGVVGPVGHAGVDDW